MARFQAQYGAQYGRAQKQTGMQQAQQAVAENNKKFLAEIGQLAGRLEQKSQSPSVQRDARQVQEFAKQVESNEQAERQV